MAPDTYLAGIHYTISLDRLFTVKEVDEFIALYQNPDTTENEIHQFFSANPKFLYLLGAYNNILSEVSFLGAKTNTLNKRECFRLDFLLRHYQNIWDVVELKKARLGGENLVVGSNRRPRFSHGLQDAIAQARVYLDELSQAEVQQELKKKGIRICRPKAWILAGRNDAISVDERRFLEQSLPHSIELMTYDDLAELSKQRAIIVTKSIQAPLITSMYKTTSVPNDADNVSSVEKLWEAVNELSQADLLRLKLSAEWLVKGDIHGYGASDLLSEATVATAQGQRPWKGSTPLLTHLLTVMKSISNSWRQHHGKELLESELLRTLESFSRDPNDTTRQAVAIERLEQIRQLFISDAVAARVVEFMGLGCTNAEIQAELALSSQEFKAIARRIRQKLQTVF